MGSYITAAKEETKNISNQLRQKYPDKMFQYGYIFYRDPGVRRPLSGFPRRQDSSLSTG